MIENLENIKNFEAYRKTQDALDILVIDGHPASEFDDIRACVQVMQFCEAGRKMVANIAETARVMMGED